MGFSHLLADLDINPKALDPKKQQTDYKIKYVTKYIEYWLLVSVNRKGVKNINFIDCMCNAGIYSDGDLGTAAITLNLYKKFAENHPDKTFNLILNDNNLERINIFKSVCNSLINTKQWENINIKYSNYDVNEYLKEFYFFDPFLNYKAGASTVLFIDPYDLGTVVINNIINFIKRYYCEVIFNVFTMDFTRNIKQNGERIKRCIGDIETTTDIDNLMAHIRSLLVNGYIKHSFSYRFKSSKNTEIYQIMFLTPHIKGIEKLKEALWEVFDGKFNHININSLEGQMSLFSKENEQKMLLDIYSVEAKEMLISHFKGQTVKYEDINSFLNENTMMKSSQFIKYVLKPLIQDDRILKCNKTKAKSNYTKDIYIIKE